MTAKERAVCPHCHREELDEKKIGNTLWEFLHTVTIANENEPNEPHRQVIFKEDFEELAHAICSKQLWR